MATDLNTILTCVTMRCFEDAHQYLVYYHLTIWGNGSTYITVNSPGRDSMSYSGNLVEPKDAE